MALLNFIGEYPVLSVIILLVLSNFIIAFVNSVRGKDTDNE